MESASKDTPLKGVKIAPEERGESGFGAFIGIATSVAAGVGAAALFTFMDLIVPGLIIGTLLAVGGSGLMVMQNRKEQKNVQHARETYALKKGYHHVRDISKDDSLIHMIKGSDDLPERIKYIKDNYGIAPVSANSFRGKHLAAGLLEAALATAVVAGGIALISTTAPALALAATMGVLAGGTTLGIHSAKVMQKYDRYIDDLAAEGAARPKEKPKEKAPEPAPAPRRVVVAQDPAPLLVDNTPQTIVVQDAPATIEYVEDAGPRRSFTQQVMASRQQPLTKVTLR